MRGTAPTGLHDPVPRRDTLGGIRKPGPGPRNFPVALGLGKGETRSSTPTNLVPSTNTLAPRRAANRRGMGTPGPSLRSGGGSSKGPAGPRGRAPRSPAPRARSRARGTRRSITANSPRRGCEAMVGMQIAPIDSLDRVRRSRGKRRGHARGRGVGPKSILANLGPQTTSRGTLM